MQYLIPVSLLSWIPITLAIFAALPPVRAMTVAVVGAWLLLPPAAIPISGLPDVDKSVAATVGICLSTLILHPNILLAFRPRWYDLITVFWCLCAPISVLQNGYGLYEAWSGLFTAVVRWALPYLIGRLYLNTLEDLRDFTVGMLAGGMLYLIPTVYEIRMSPVFQRTIYGTGGWTGVRFGGYRPYVFLANGLEHGMWMTIVSFLGVWLWKSGTLRRIGPLPMGTVALPILLLVTLLCRSSGALFLLIAGLAAMWVSTRFRTKLLVLALLIISPAYYALRIPNLWTGDNLVQLVATYFNEERAGSLGYRFNCENLLVARALQQPIWGWAGWGRNLVRFELTGGTVPTDGLWVIQLGLNGLVGLFLWTATAILPSLLFLRRFSIRQWTDPLIAPAAAISVLLGLYQVDCLVNAFPNLPLLTAAGGLIALTPRASRQRVGAADAAEFDASLEQDMALAADAPGPVGDLSPIPPQFRLADRYRQLSKTLRQQGKADECRSALMHAYSLFSEVARHPESGAFWKQRWDCANDVAWFLFIEEQPGVDAPTLAVRLATEATEAFPQCAAYWNTLGATLLGVGEPQACIAAIERSMQLGGSATPYDFLLLALAHARLGELDQAMYWRDQGTSCMDQSMEAHPDLRRLDAQITASLPAGSRPSPVNG